MSQENLPTLAGQDIAPARPIRMMSWNIRHGLGNDDRVDLDRIAQVITDSGATIVGLQEVDRGGARSGRVDQAAWLGNELEMEAHFAPNATFHPGDDHVEPHHYGVAILTAYPVVAVEHRLLTNDFGWEQRGALAMTLDLGNGRRLTVVNTHLQWAGEDNEVECSRQRGQQIAEILDIARESGGDAIVMGDFNAEPGTPELAAIETPDSGMIDAWRAVNLADPGYTFPSHPTEVAAKRIDYLFVNDGLRVDAATVLNTPVSRLASDHFPILADVASMA